MKNSDLPELNTPAKRAIVRVLRKQTAIYGNRELFERAAGRALSIETDRSVLLRLATAEKWLLDRGVIESKWISGKQRISLSSSTIPNARPITQLKNLSPWCLLAAPAVIGLTSCVVIDHDTSKETEKKVAVAQPLPSTQWAGYPAMDGVAKVRDEGDALPAPVWEKMQQTQKPISAAAATLLAYLSASTPSEKQNALQAPIARAHLRETTRTASLPSPTKSSATAIGSASPQTGESVGVPSRPLVAKNIPHSKSALVSSATSYDQAITLISSPSTVTPVDKAAATTLEMERREVQNNINEVNNRYAQQSTGTALKLDTVFASAKRIVPFSFSAASLAADTKSMVLEMVPFAQKANRIYIRGRTDSTGTAEMNRTLAMSRAVSVTSTLLAGGVPKEKVKTTYCTTCYAASNSTEEGRRANRRVEIVMVMPAPLAAKFADPTLGAQPTLIASKTLPHNL